MKRRNFLKITAALPILSTPIIATEQNPIIATETQKNGKNNQVTKKDTYYVIDNIKYRNLVFRHNLSLEQIFDHGQLATYESLASVGTIEIDIDAIYQDIWDYSLNFIAPIENKEWHTSKVTENNTESKQPIYIGIKHLELSILGKKDFDLNDAKPEDCFKLMLTMYPNNNILRQLTITAKMVKMQYSPMTWNLL